MWYQTRGTHNKQEDKTNQGTIKVGNNKSCKTFPSLCSFSPCPSQQVSALPLPAPPQLECSEESHVVVKVLAFFLCVQEEFDMVETHNGPWLLVEPIKHTSSFLFVIQKELILLLTTQIKNSKQYTVGIFN